MADVRTFLGQLLQASATSGKAPYSAARRQWLTTLDGHRQEWAALVAPGFSDESSPIAPQRAARGLELAVPDDAIVVTHNRHHHPLLNQSFPPALPHPLHCSLGF